MAATSLVRAGALVGLCLSAYALWVEHRVAEAAARGEEYDALCDFDSGPLAGASCTSVFGSRAGKLLSYWDVVPSGSLLDVSNAFAGCGFYAAVLGAPALAALAAVPTHTVLVPLALAGAAFSVYLVYLLAVVLHDFCVVCMGMHACNAAILLGACLGAAAAARRAASAQVKAKSL